MKDDEARAIAAAVADADGGCPVCAGAITGRLSYEIPDVDWVRLVVEAGPSNLKNDAESDRPYIDAWAETVRTEVDAGVDWAKRRAMERTKGATE